MVAVVYKGLGDRQPGCGKEMEMGMSIKEKRITEAPRGDFLMRVEISEVTAFF